MFRYSLIKGSKKSICPECSKKTFVNYQDNETGEILPYKVGRCDREINCGYHVTPKEYFGNTNVIHAPDTTHKKVIQTRKKTSYHPYEYVKKALKGTDNFTNFLRTLFSDEEVNTILNNYKIGTATHWDQSTIFWQIDSGNRVRGGKVMLYDNNGKRTKFFTWIHAILLKKKIISTFHQEQCLFGLHLIHQSDKPIAIVESEKTACIMSIKYPKYLWLANGSSNNLADKFFIPVKNRTIVMFPDLSKDDLIFYKWKERAGELQKFGFDISVSSLLQEHATDDDKLKGLDIADYFLRIKPFEETKEAKRHTGSENNPLTITSFLENRLNKLKAKNSALQSLINTFELETG